MNWVRLWSDMPTDPKWRVVAKRSGRPLTEVLAVFVFMMTNAGANATERGVLDNWWHDDIAAALDMEPEHVEAIYEAMQGKTLDGAALTGWEKRQPKREDGAAERAKAWRERNRTQANARKRPDTEPDTDIETNPLPSEQEAAREGEGFRNFELEGVGVGGQAFEITTDTKRAVCQALQIGDAGPIVRAYRLWTGSRRARSPDAHFRSSASKIFRNLSPADRAECQPLLEAQPEIVVTPARPSPQLLARLGAPRHAH